MVGKFLKPGAIADTIRSEVITNSLQARSGGPIYHVDTIPCGCPDDNCGAFHRIQTERPLPSPSEADATLRARRGQKD